jgi:hypothetical protein
VGWKRSTYVKAVLLGDALHGGDVKFEVGVFLPAVREVADGGEVFEGDRRDEHETRRGLAVIGLGQRVGDERVELGFVIGGCGRGRRTTRCSRRRRR